jgi:hypothetical protein
VAERLLHAFSHEGYARAGEELLSWRLMLRGSKKKTAADRRIPDMQEQQEIMFIPPLVLVVGKSSAA